MKTVKQVSLAWQARSLFIVAMMLALAVPATARERKTLQRVTSAPADPQVRYADSWIDQTAGSTNSNHGSDTTLHVSSANNQNQRTLVLFDLSSIPNGGIKLATLTLFMSQAPSQSRTYEAHRITSLWTEAAVTWASRLPATQWVVGAAGGGDFSGATSTTATGTTSNVSLSWVLTTDVQRWFGSQSPSANYGTLIKDRTENSGTARTAIFSSVENATEANRPSLTVEFVSNVQGLTATAGNAQITLTWSYPPTVGTVLSATNGVLILRQAGTPILATVAPTDGTTYTRNAGCTNTIGAATIVFSSNSLPTSFNDSAAGDNPNCPPANGTTYFYKVFEKDAANNYSANGGSSIFVPLITATPGATMISQQAAAWLMPTGGTTLSAPGLIPSSVAVVGSSSNLLVGAKPSDGTPVFSAVSLGGSTIGRPPALEAAIASIGRPVTYVANQDNFVYAIDSSTGQIIWLTNPTGLTTNTFTGGAGLVVKALASSAYTRGTDLVIVGTRNAGTTTGNQIVAIDGNTGNFVWSVVGNSGGNPSMDIVASTPLIDYVHNTIWVTTHSAGGITQPSLWKMNANSGALLTTAALGNISSSPTLTRSSDVLFVGNDAGVVTAINPVTGATYDSFNGGDGVVTGFPVVEDSTSPYVIIFSGNTSVQAVLFSTALNKFVTTGAGIWVTAMPGGCVPSTPITLTDLGKVYVGCSDGHLYQLNFLTGVIEANRILSPNTTVGDPSLDVEQSRIIVGVTNSRVYAFGFPF